MSYRFRFTYWCVCPVFLFTQCRVPVLTGYGVVLASDWMTGSTGRKGSHRFWSSGRLCLDVHWLAVTARLQLTSFPSVSLVRYTFPPLYPPLLLPLSFSSLLISFCPPLLLFLLELLSSLSSCDLPLTGSSMSWLSRLNPRGPGSRSGRSAAPSSPCTADPETCLMVFENHWRQVSQRHTRPVQFALEPDRFIVILLLADISYLQVYLHQRL